MSQSAVLRRMTEDDIAAVIEIENRAYPFPWTEGIFNDCIRVGYTCWVLEQTVDDQSSIIGYVILSIAVGEMHILNICVDPLLQGKGIGRALLKDIEKYALNKSAVICFLEVRVSNKIAIHLYESEGFEEVGYRKEYYKDHAIREDAIVMAKKY